MERTDEKVEAIIGNFRERNRDVKEANRQLSRAERILSARRSEDETPRNILQGPQGGLYYTRGGRKIYLSPGQCRKCENGALRRVQSGCPPRIVGRCQPTRSELQRNIQRLEKKRKTLKRKLRRQTRRRKSCKERLKRMERQFGQIAD